jgi:arabinogalactan endo-1,4-beta-galactosidase
MYITKNMKRLVLFTFSLMMAGVALAQIATKDFVKGADVGFLQGQERRGVKFHDRKGQERECLELLKTPFTPTLTTTPSTWKYASDSALNWPA